MIVLTAESHLGYFSQFQFSMPRYILITLFCALGMVLYPVAIFDNKKIKTVGAALGGAIVVLLTVVCLLKPPVYSTDLMDSDGDYSFDDSYTVSFENDRYGNVKIRYDDSFEEYILHADFKRSGDTVLTIVSPKGEKTEFDLHIERNTYQLTKRNS